MLEIPLIHGTVWINPYRAIAIEAASVNGGAINGSFITMDSGVGWNTPLSPRELAAKIGEYKRDFSR